MTSQNAVRAACLTPAGAGGIAVIQVIGRRAADIVAPHLQSERSLDLESLVPDRLRFCRVVDGDETIDDAVIAVRRDESGRLVIDLNLHGGLRVVQRVLMLLRKADVEIVEGREFPRIEFEGRPILDREAAEALMLVKTRPVASWLARSIERLPAEIDAILDGLQAGRIADIRPRVADCCIRGERARLLLNGVRAVLVGRPNTGKSTLANRLAGRDLAVVSDQPGTTRDWTEHPGAIAGIPFTFVDTAGIRPTVDPIECEAIRRTHAQIAPADVAIRVIDTSCPPYEDDLHAIESPAIVKPRMLLVWNKTDLGIHQDHSFHIRRVRERAAVVSAATGHGLSDLRRGIVNLLGLAGWETVDTAPYTERQLACCLAVLSALDATPPDVVQAVHWLKSVSSGELVQDDA